MRTRTFCALIVSVLSSLIACGGDRHSLSCDARPRRQRDALDRGPGHWQMVSVRAGPESDAALASLRRDQLPGKHQLRHEHRTSANGAQASGRGRPCTAGTGRTASSANRVRHLCLEPRGRFSQPQPETAEERTMEIRRRRMGSCGRRRRTTPRHSRWMEGPVSFTMGGKYRYVGRINASSQVERVQTWIDNTVTGDTPVEILLGLRFRRRAVSGAHRAHTRRPSRSRDHGDERHGQCARRHRAARGRA